MQAIVYVGIDFYSECSHLNIKIRVFFLSHLTAAENISFQTTHNQNAAVIEKNCEIFFNSTFECFSLLWIEINSFSCKRWKTNQPDHWVRIPHETNAKRVCFFIMWCWLNLIILQHILLAVFRNICHCILMLVQVMSVYRYYSITKFSRC